MSTPTPLAPVAPVAPVASFDAHSRVFIEASVYARSFGEELVLLDFARGEYFGLDEVGADVWRGLEQNLPLGGIATLIASRFDVTSDQALNDIVAIVVDLINNGLVRPHSGT